MGQDAAAIGRGGLIEHFILVKAQVDSVGGQAGFERNHHAGGQVTAQGSGAVEDDGGLVLLCHLGESRLIGAGAVLRQSIVLHQNHVVRAVSKEGICQSSHILAQQDRADFFAGVGLQLLGLCQKFKHCAVEFTVLLLGKHPYSFVITFRHGCCLLISDARHAAYLQSERRSLRQSRRSTWCPHCAWAAPEPPWLRRENQECL